MFIRRGLRRLGERGDTIVEVLIAIAIVSVILGGAYVTTNNSLRATRGAQERGDALKLVQGQLESLKELATSNPTAILGSGTPAKFCIVNNTSVISAVGATAGQCVLTAAGTTAPTGAQPAYALSVSRQADGHTFIINNKWVGVEAEATTGTNDIQMTYRVYQQ